MSTLKGMLTAVETSKERSWQDALPNVQLALNCTINRVTNSSPLELFIERNQIKLDPKYKGPFFVSQILDGDRYVLKSLNCNRYFKYSHDRLRKMPTNEVPDDLSDENESANIDS
ncbi:hypothetical protein ACJJTC_004916 [Scirpophaga incertulas]